MCSVGKAAERGVPTLVFVIPTLQPSARRVASAVRDASRKSRTRGHGGHSASKTRVNALMAPLPTLQLPAAAAAHQPQDQQQQDRADGRGDDARNKARAEVDPQAGKQPAGDQRSDDADADVGDDAEAGPADDHSREPPGDEPYHDDDEKLFPG